MSEATGRRGLLVKVAPTDVGKTVVISGCWEPKLLHEHLVTICVASITLGPLIWGNCPTRYIYSSCYLYTASSGCDDSSRSSIDFLHRVMGAWLGVSSFPRQCVFRAEIFQLSLVPSPRIANLHRNASLKPAPKTARNSSIQVGISAYIRSSFDADIVSIFERLHVCVGSILTGTSTKTFRKTWCPPPTSMPRYPPLTTERTAPQRPSSPLPCFSSMLKPVRPPLSNSHRHTYHDRKNILLIMLWSENCHAVVVLSSDSIYSCRPATPKPRLSEYRKYMGGYTDGRE